MDRVVSKVKHGLTQLGINRTNKARTEV